MSGPAPLEAYVCRPDGSGFHHAALYDPATGKVLMTAQERGHDAALERLLRLKAHSRVSRRRYVVKSNRPTHKGKVTEEDTTNTPMHVGRAGHLSLFPEAQQKLPLGTPAKSEA